MQHFLKASSGSARTRIVATEALEQLFASADHAVAALHA